MFFKHINLKIFSGNKYQKIVIPYLLSYQIEILKNAVSLQKILQTIKIVFIARVIPFEFSFKLFH